jgi:rubrerythrin
MIVNYPRLTSRLENEETREKALRLGQDSVRHADIVSNLITQLGGEPIWNFETITPEAPLADLFGKQLETEKLAHTVYDRCAETISDVTQKTQLQDIAREEAEHIQIVKDILDELGVSY